MRYGIITAVDSGTRKLCRVAVEVASLKLGIPPPPLLFIESSAAGVISAPFAVRGMTWVDPGGEVNVCIRHDQTPEQLSETCFHEVHHVKSLMDDLERGSPTQRQVAEGQADFFCRSESPSGDYEAVMRKLCSMGAELSIQADQPRSAATFAALLEAYDAKAAKRFQTRADVLARSIEAIREANQDWISPQQKQEENAEWGREFRARVARERKALEFERAMYRLDQKRKSIMAAPRPVEQIRHRLVGTTEWHDGYPVSDEK